MNQVPSRLPASPHFPVFPVFPVFWPSSWLSGHKYPLPPSFLVLENRRTLRTSTYSFLTYQSTATTTMSSSRTIRPYTRKPDPLPSTYGQEVSKGYRASEKTQQMLRPQNSAAVSEAIADSSHTFSQDYPEEDIHFIKALYYRHTNSWTVAMVMLRFRAYLRLQKVATANRKKDVGNLIMQRPCNIREVWRSNEYNTIKNKAEKKIIDDYITHGFGLIDYLSGPDEIPSHDELMRILYNAMKTNVGEKEIWVENLLDEYQRMEIELRLTDDDRPIPKRVASTPFLGR